MNKKTNKLSMKWYGFFYTIKLPVSITLAVIAYTCISFKYDMNFRKGIFDTTTFILWLSYLATAILYTILLYKMYYKDKDTYYYTIVCIIIDIFILYTFIVLNNGINMINIIIFFIAAILWSSLNYIYFRKRREYLVD